MSRLAVSHLVLLAFLLLLSACGGGSGGGTADDAPSTSIWHVSAVSADFDPDYRGRFGTWTVGPAGQVSAIETTNRNSVVGEATSSEGTFVDDGAGAYRVRGDLGGQAVDAFRGFMSQGGELAIHSTANVVPGAQPGIGALVRAGEGYATEDLLGAWHLIFADFYHFWSEMHTIVTSVQFEANQTLSFATGTVNWNGTINPIPPFTKQGFSVEPDGTARVISDSWRIGGLTRDRQFLIGGGAEPALGGLDAHPGMLLAIRMSTEASSAGLDGRYGYVRLVRTDTGFEAWNGIATFDGTRQVRISDTARNREGTMSTPPGSAIGTYSVYSNGMLSMNLLGESWSYRGAVSQNGRYAMLGGGSEPGSPTGVWIFVRLGDA